MTTQTDPGAEGTALADGRDRPPAIVVSGLTKKYGDIEAVRGIDFEVARGETFGFLGPNGAGKSTTIKILCTLAKPTAGQASVAGHDVVRERDAVRRNIGLVFQDTTLDNYLTGAQNLRFHAELYAVPGAAVAPRMRQVLDMVGLWDRRDSLVQTYSGGMQRRLEIARGLLHAPRVLFLDEPTVGLDPQTRSSIWEYINELKRREDITIFLTTHYMDEAEHCDRIAIIDHGKIVAIDTPEQLKASVGKDRVQIQTEDDEAAIRELAEVFGIEAGHARGGGHVRGRGRRGVRAAAVRPAERADPLGQRVPAIAGRRVHVLHREDDPGRRGVRHRPHAADGHPHPGKAITMATQTAAPAAAQDEALAQQIRVAVPERSLRSDLRAVSIVWRREMIRFRRDRLRAITSLVQPLLFLFVLGTGLSSLAGRSLPSGVDFKTFIYPGVLAMSVLFTAIFSAASIVWDREFGFLREMLVAPVSRAAIVIGKCLGGATIATFQGIVILALAGVAHVPYNPVLFLTLIGELLLLSFTITAFGVMMAARITQFQAFMALTQMLVLPLFFLSGALYPLNGLPGWLSVLTRIDPLTYVVGPMRHAVFAHLNINPLFTAHLSPSITWLGWPVPIWLSLAIVAAMGLGMLGVAIAEFSKTE